MFGPPIARTTAVCVLLAGAACGGGSNESANAAAKAPTPAADPAGDPAEAAAKDPQREAKIRDLDALCAALNRDYGDGTLGDYFAGLEMKTDWGAAVLAEGNEADRPGRLLQAKIESLSPEAKDAGLDACRELLDYIDEVE